MDADQPVRELQVFPVDFTGQPGDFTAVLWSAGAAGVFVPEAHGPLLLTAPFHVILLGVLPASGTASVSASFPDLGPGVEGMRVFTQPLFRSAGGSLTLGAPLTAIVLDSAF